MDIIKSETREALLLGSEMTITFSECIDIIEMDIDIDKEALLLIGLEATITFNEGIDIINSFKKRKVDVVSKTINNYQDQSDTKKNVKRYRKIDFASETIDNYRDQSNRKRETFLKSNGRFKSEVIQPITQWIKLNGLTPTMKDRKKLSKITGLNKCQVNCYFTNARRRCRQKINSKG